MLLVALLFVLLPSINVCSAIGQVDALRPPAARLLCAASWQPRSSAGGLERCGSRGKAPLSYSRRRGGARRQVSSAIRANTRYARVKTQVDIVIEQTAHPTLDETLRLNRADRPPTDPRPTQYAANLPAQSGGKPTPTATGSTLNRSQTGEPVGIANCVPIPNRGQSQPRSPRVRQR